MNIKSLLAILNILHDEDSECSAELESIQHEFGEDNAIILTGHFDNLSMKSFRSSPFNSIEIISSTEILINI